MVGSADAEVLSEQYGSFRIRRATYPVSIAMKESILNTIQDWDLWQFEPKQAM